MTCGNPSGGRHADRLQNPKVISKQNDVRKKWRAGKMTCGKGPDARRRLRVVKENHASKQNDMWESESRPVRDKTLGSQPNKMTRGKMTCGKKWRAETLQKYFGRVQNLEGPAVIFASGLYHEWQTHFLHFREESVIRLSYCVILFFNFPAAPSKMCTSEKCISSFRTIGKVTFLEVLISDVAPLKKITFLKSDFWIFEIIIYQVLP